MAVTKAEIFEKWTEETPRFAQEVSRYLKTEERLVGMATVDTIPADYAYVGRIGTDPYSWSALTAQALQAHTPGSVLLQALPWNKEHGNIFGEELWKFTSPYGVIHAYAPAEHLSLVKDMLTPMPFSFTDLESPHYNFLRSFAIHDVPDPAVVGSEAIADLLPQEYAEAPERAVAMVRGGFMLSTLRMHAHALSTPGDWPMIASQYHMYLHTPGRFAYEEYRARGFEPISGEAIHLMANAAIGSMIDFAKRDEE